MYYVCMYVLVLQLQQFDLLRLWASRIGKDPIDIHAQTTDINTHTPMIRARGKRRQRGRERERERDIQTITATDTHTYNKGMKGMDDEHGHLVQRYICVCMYVCMYVYTCMCM